MKYLVEQGANITQKHNILGTPLALAKKIKNKNKNEIIEYLESKIVKLNNDEKSKPSQAKLLITQSPVLGSRKSRPPENESASPSLKKRRLQ